MEGGYGVVMGWMGLGRWYGLVMDLDGVGGGYGASGSVKVDLPKKNGARVLSE
jgi:hypothetical protein